jgi:hypothetical protein
MENARDRAGQLILCSNQDSAISNQEKHLSFLDADCRLLIADC